MVFDYFRGSFAASRVSRATMSCCANLVNFLISGGFGVRMADTAHILSEFYCFARFGYQVLHPSDSIGKRGAYVALLGDNLRDLLEQTWGQGLPMELIRADRTVDTVIGHLNEFFHDWLKRLYDLHRDEPRGTDQDWISYAMAHTWDNISFYLYDEYNNNPDREDEVGAIHEKHIFMEIQKNLLALAANLK